MNVLLKWTVLGLALYCVGCGSAARPANAYGNAADLMADMAKKRDKISSFRITGRVDHFGVEHRIQGKIFLFAQLPSKLRVDLLSPFGSTLSVLTVNDGRFAMSDIREGRYLEGPAEPCNIARLVRIPLPPEDVARVLVGHTPIIDGVAEVIWSDKGYYRVTISDGDRIQRLDVGSDPEVLPLLRSRLEDSQGRIFDMSFERWRPVEGIPVPHEIRVKMPRDGADLLVRYDDDGVELNVKMPTDAWDHSFPDGADVEHVACD